MTFSPQWVRVVSAKVALEERTDAGAEKVKN